MKKRILILMLAATATAYSQGGVDFNNRVLQENIDAPISYSGIGPVPAGRIDGATSIVFGDRVWGGINAMVGLYYGPAGTPENELIQLVPPVGFRTGAAAGYFDGGIRALNGVTPGSTAVFQVRVWDVGIPNVTSYEEAVAIANSSEGYLGVSGLLNEPIAAGTTYLHGLQAFTIPVIPEPSTIGLAMLGLAAGLLMLRKKRG